MEAKEEAPALAPDALPSPAPPPAAPTQIAAEADDELFEGDTYEEDPRDQVADLANDIEARVGAYMEDFGIESAAQEHRATCAQVCDLREAICGSSQRICDISSRHPSDPWITDRCEWSGKQCQDATQRCERCNP